MSAIFCAMFVCPTDIIFWFWKADNDTKNLSVMYLKAGNMYMNVEQIVSFFRLGY